MRKHSLKLSVFILTLLLIAALTVCFAACDSSKDDPQTPEDPTPEEHTTHTPDSTTEWHSDDTDHWRLCVEGGEPLDKAAHNFVLKNDNEHHYLECEVCHKIKDTEDHITIVVKDANGHHIECTKEGCAYATQSASHNYGVGVDAGDGKHTLTCTFDGCGYQKQENHDLSYEHIAEGGHRQVCSVCEYEGSKENCVEGDDPTFTDKQDGEHHTYVCTLCGGTETIDHTLGNWESDGANHYKVCADCDAVVQTAACTPAETFQTDSQKHFKLCTICNNAVTSTQSNHNLIWKQNEQKTQHFKGCDTCSYIQEDTIDDHTPSDEYVCLDDDNCGKQCTTCSLFVEQSAHDYEQGSHADCLNCGYYNNAWQFEDEEAEELVISQFVGEYTNGMDLTVPAYYKDKSIVGLKGKFIRNATPYNFLNLQSGGFNKLVISEGIKAVNTYALYQIKINDLYLPDSLEDISGMSAPFNNTQGYTLNNVYINDLDAFITKDLTGGVFMDSRAEFPTMLYADGKLVDSITIADGADAPKNIDNCDSIKKIVFEGAFTANFTNLRENLSLPCVEDVYVKDLATYYAMYGGKTILNYFGGGANLYVGDELLTSVSLTDEMLGLTADVTSDVTFLSYCTSLETLIIDETQCTHINIKTTSTFKFSLAGCSSLKYLDLGKKILKTFAGSFEGCDALTTVVTYIKNTNGTEANTWKDVPNLKSVYFFGTSAAMEKSFNNMTKDGNDPLFEADFYLMATSDPGEGNRAYKWNYDENHMVTKWYEEPECDGHDFQYHVEDTYHYQQCTKCTFRLNNVNHTAVDPEKFEQADGKHWNLCECGAHVNEATHDTNGGYESDATNHWSVCSKCGVKSSDDVAHTESENYQSVDGGHMMLCSVCDQPMGTVQPHDQAGELAHDNDGHYHLCSVCGDRGEDIISHSEDGEPQGDSNGHWYLCSECGAKAGGTLLHVPGTKFSNGDATGHDVQCKICGETYHAEHRWIMDGEYSTGICADCDYSVFTLNEQGEITKYTGNFAMLSVPSQIGEVTVTGIADASTMTSGVFYNATTLVSLKLPSTMTRIGNNGIAMQNNNSALKELFLPEGLQSLGDSALYTINNLDSLVIPDSVTEWGTMSVALSAWNLRYIVYGEGVDHVGSQGIGALYGSGTGANTLEYVLFKGNVTKNTNSPDFYCKPAYFKTQRITSRCKYFLSDCTLEEAEAWIANTSEVTRSDGETSGKYLFYVYSQLDPNAISMTFPGYVTGAWHYDEDGNPVVWNDTSTGTRITVEKSEYYFDFATTSDDKTLQLNVVYASSEYAWSAVSEGVTITADGVATLSAPGKYTVKVALVSDPTVSKEVNIIAFSSQPYLVGTIYGQQVTEQQPEYTLTYGNNGERRLTLLVNLKKGDKFSVQMNGTSYKFTADDYVGDYSSLFDISGNEFTAKLTELYVFSYSYQYGEFSFTIFTTHYRATIEGREGDAAAIGEVKSVEAVATSTGDIVVAITFSGSDVKKKSYPNLQIRIDNVVTGVSTWYLGAAGEPTVKISGNAYAANSKSVWASDSSTKCNFWWGTSSLPNYTWTWTLTISVDGTLKAVVIDKV